MVVGVEDDAVTLVHLLCVLITVLTEMSPKRTSHFEEAKTVAASAANLILKKQRAEHCAKCTARETAEN